MCLHIASVSRAKINVRAGRAEAIWRGDVGRLHGHAPTSTGRIVTAAAVAAASASVLWWSHRTSDDGPAARRSAFFARFYFASWMWSRETRVVQCSFFVFVCVCRNPNYGFANILYMPNSLRTVAQALSDTRVARWRVSRCALALSIHEMYEAFARAHLTTTKASS